jgi:hypothetical protein
MVLVNKIRVLGSED